MENLVFVPNMCQSVLKVTREFHISIGHNDLRQIMQFDNTVKEYLSNSISIGSSRTMKKMGHFEEKKDPR